MYSYLMYVGQAFTESQTKCMIVYRVFLFFIHGWTVIRDSRVD